MDILIIKITITVNKNPLGMLNGSLNAAEVRISEMENRSVENSKMKDRKSVGGGRAICLLNILTVYFAEQKFLIKIRCDPIFQFFHSWLISVLYLKKSLPKRKPSRFSPLIF